MIDEKGQNIIDKEECDMDADDLMMQALDAGAEDFADEDDSYEITTAPADFDAVRTALEEAGITMASAEVTMIPQTYVTLTDEADITNIGRILDLLDVDDVVEEVYHIWVEYTKYYILRVLAGGEYEKASICSFRVGTIFKNWRSCRCVRCTS